MSRRVHIGLARIWQSLAVICIGIGVTVVLVGSYVIVAQVILWLKSGEWVSLPLYYLFVDPRPLLEQLPPQAWLVILTSQYSDPLFVLQMGVDTYLNGLSAWLLDPKEWVGLHKIVKGILEIIPISLFLIWLGGMVWGAAMASFAKAEGLVEKLTKERAVLDSL